MKHTHQRAQAFALGVILTVAVSRLAGAVTTAETDSFTQNGAQLPISARTLFYDGVWNTSDPQNTAEHELLHAIGFTINYSLFNAHVFTQAGDRNYRQNTDGTGTILGILTASTTHLDAGRTTPAPDNYNQANDIMRPDKVDNQRAGQKDKAILNNAFNWTALGGLSITVNVSGTPFAAADMTAINAAVTDIQDLFVQGANPKAFTWTVVNVPEPGGMTLVVLGLGLIAAPRFLGRTRVTA
jgi:hypothetical protein